LDSWYRIIVYFASLRRRKKQIESILEQHNEDSREEDKEKNKVISFYI